MALTSATETTLATALADFKEFMDQDKVLDLIWSNNPVLALMARNPKAAGAYIDTTVKYGGTQGIVLGGSASAYTNAVNNQSPEQYAVFHEPMAFLYDLGTIENSAIRASRNREGGFEEIVQGAMRSAIKNCANEVSRAMFSAGTASIGQITALSVNSDGSANVTLASSLSYQNFEYDMTLDVSATDGSAPLGSPTTATVVEVDAAAGILVLSAPSTGSWGSGSLVVGVFLIRDGNYNTVTPGNNISTQQGQVAFSPMAFEGIPAFIPSYAYRQAGGLKNQFLNVNRSVDGTRLGGLGLNGSNMQIIDALIYGMEQLSIYSDGPDVVVVNPNTHNAILQALQTNRLYTDVIVNAEIAFKAVTIEGGPKPLKVIRDRHVQPKQVHFLNMASWELASMGEAIAQMDFAGLPFLPLANLDANQVKAGGYLNVRCLSPRDNATMSVNV